MGLGLVAYAVTGDIPERVTDTSRRTASGDRSSVAALSACRQLGGQLPGRDVVAGLATGRALGDEVCQEVAEPVAGLCHVVALVQHRAEVGAVRVRGQVRVRLQHRRKALNRAWVVVKLALTVGATLLLLVHSRPIDHLAAVASDTGVLDPSLSGTRIQLVVVAELAVLVLLATTALGTVKPRGMTRYGRRRRRDASDAAPVRSPAPAVG